MYVPTAVWKEPFTTKKQKSIILPEKKQKGKKDTNLPLSKEQNEPKENAWKIFLESLILLF